MKAVTPHEIKTFGELLAVVRDENVPMDIRNHMEKVLKAFVSEHPELGPWV